VAARLFLRPAIRKLCGLPEVKLEPTIRGRLSTNLASQAGREDWIPVRLSKDQESSGLVIEPVFGRSNFIFNLVRADGLVRVPPASNGLEAGEWVEMVPW
jgi:molybdopterin molybdotransferase